MKMTIKIGVEAPYKMIQMNKPALKSLRKKAKKRKARLHPNQLKALNPKKRRVLSQKKVK